MQKSLAIGGFAALAALLISLIARAFLGPSVPVLSYEGTNGLWEVRVNACPTARQVEAILPVVDEVWDDWHGGMCDYLGTVFFAEMAEARLGEGSVDAVPLQGNGPKSFRPDWGPGAFYMKSLNGRQGMCELALPVTERRYLYVRSYGDGVDSPEQLCYTTLELAKVFAAQH